MSRYIRALVLVGSLLAASRAEAAVVISEIAWMGTDAEGGSSCEWVELHNPDGAAVNLSGWKVRIENTGSTAKDLPLSELNGFNTILEPSGYYLLARSSGACLEQAPGAQADWSGSFGTGISNTATKLMLYDSAGILMDVIDASDGWGDVGGYNASGKPKLTPQRNGMSWVTATPTPRAVNATVSEETSTPSSTSSQASSASKKVTMPQIYIDAGGDRVVSAFAHTIFNSLVYTDGKNLVGSPRVFWSYGEGSADRSQTGYHMYRKPGEYLVNVRAEHGWRTASDSFIVTVDQAEVRISGADEDGIHIENFDDRVLDLAYWRLEAGGEEFEIPPGTAILPGRSVLFPADVTGLSVTKTARLLYPSGKLMNEFEVETQEAPGE